MPQLMDSPERFATPFATVELVLYWLSVLDCIDLTRIGSP